MRETSSFAVDRTVRIGDIPERMTGNYQKPSKALETRLGRIERKLDLICKELEIKV